MLDTFNVRTTDMPVAMRILFEQYPRGSWEAHPEFREKTQHWLGPRVPCPEHKLPATQPHFQQRIRNTPR